MSSKIKKIFIFHFVSLSIFAAGDLWADIQSKDVQDRKVANESEVGFVSIRGNSESESLSAKQQNIYKWDKNLVRGDGRYLRSQTGGLETASRWLFGLRYEREMSERLSLFVAQNVESDPYAGIDRRYNSDFGLKYFLIKEDSREWVSELGYRYTTEFPVQGDFKEYHQGRLFTQWAEKFSESISVQVWAEYIPNFTDNKSYLANAEVSLSASLSKIFSLKTAYLVHYNNADRPNIREKTDTTTTVTLVAKF